GVRGHRRREGSHPHSARAPRPLDLPASLRPPLQGGPEGRLGRRRRPPRLHPRGRPGEPRVSTPSPLRWRMIGLAFWATAINYLDRQTLSVAAPVLSEQFHMSDVDYSRVTTAFL